MNVITITFIEQTNSSVLPGSADELKQLTPCPACLFSHL